jgi:hypothetical protein
VASSDDSPMDEHELAMQAYEVFTEWFAKPYRERGRTQLVGPMHGTAEEQGRALLVHEFLVRRGLTEPTNSPRIFRITNEGKDLAFRDADLRALLGIPGAADDSMTPENVRLRAQALFNEFFAGGQRGLRVRPSTPLETEAFEELTRKGLTRRHEGGTFSLGERGAAVRMGEAALADVLAARSNLPAAAPSSVTNVFAGPVGAVAAAPGAVAHGTVNTQQVDDALRELVERQDELGELTNSLFLLLRAARQRASEEELQQQIADAEEFKAFEKALRAGPATRTLEAATAVLKMVPVLKSAVDLLT